MPHFDTVHEGRRRRDQRDQVGRIHAAPALPGGLEQLVGDGQPGCPAAGPLVLHSKARKGALLPKFRRRQRFRAKARGLAGRSTMRV